MRKINENDYVDFTIACNGWTLTFHIQERVARMEQNRSRMYIVREQAKRNPRNH